MQLYLNKELYNFAEWCVCRWRNNEKQFILSNSQTDNQVMFTIFFIYSNIYLQNLPYNCTASWYLILKKNSLQVKIESRRNLPGSNFRIPRNSFTCHWIRIASIVLCLDLQSLPTHVSEADQSCGVFWSLAPTGNILLHYVEWLKKIREGRRIFTCIDLGIFFLQKTLGVQIKETFDSQYSLVAKVIQFKLCI